MSKFFTSSNIAKLGIFSALATVLYFINFPLPIFPSFLEIHFSDLPALICGFALGPIGGALTVLVKVLIKLPFTSTFCVGECADLITGLLYVIPASIIYQKGKSKSSAIKGMVIGALCSVASSILVNWFVLIPVYSKIVVSFSVIVSMCSKIFPAINEGNFYTYYLTLSVLPFNVLRCLISGLLTIFVYKRVSNLLKRF